jgi:hypothetical protein
VLEFSFILQECFKIIIYCVLLEQFLDKCLDKNARCKQKSAYMNLICYSTFFLKKRKAKKKKCILVLMCKNQQGRKVT